MCYIVWLMRNFNIEDIKISFKEKITEKKNSIELEILELLQTHRKI